MSKIPITVCIIAKNEEKHIEECLKHLIKYGFEIIVTDTGSTDRTKEIACKYADKVVDFEWVDDFSAARNYCASFANNNWILSLDCDEYVNDINIKILRILMQKFPKSAGVIRLKNLVYTEAGNEGYGTDDVTRFYNKHFYEFVGAIHEQVTIKEISKRDDKLQCFLMPMEVIHHGYALSYDEMVQKQERNLELLYKQIEKGEEDSYIYFQIGQSEYILGHYDTAIEYYEKGMMGEPSTEFIYVQIMITSLAKAYVKVGRLKEAADLMDKYASQCKTAKYSFTHASVMLDNKQYIKALMLYVKTTTMSDADTLGENLMHCYEHIIGLYQKLGNPQMAEIFRDRFEKSMRERERVLSC